MRPGDPGFGEEPSDRYGELRLRDPRFGTEAIALTLTICRRSFKV